MLQVFPVDRSEVIYVGNDVGNLDTINVIFCLHSHIKYNQKAFWGDATLRPCKILLSKTIMLQSEIKFFFFLFSSYPYMFWQDLKNTSTQTLHTHLVPLNRRYSNLYSGLWYPVSMTANTSDRYKRWYLWALHGEGRYSNWICHGRLAAFPNLTIQAHVN